eukprot:GFUD01015933.1.p1 GENE.GFUD01015933.1~~GFUD01015933.1.p1  ORF type:complete len:344 (+),score=104.07 GFUD01015933.1:340-1371(+)
MAVQDAVFSPLLAGQKFGVWRVKQLKLIPVPEKDQGKFYSGDCYLVFHNAGGEHIFFWLGADSSYDEQAVVAIKAVELDNLFNGMPVQHREMQGFESIRFKKLFKGGIVTLLGGFEAGLKQVQKIGHVARLFQVRGGKMPALSEVALDWGHMNHGDTFVVDTGSIIFIWAGVSSSGMEKVVAAGLASKLRDRVGEEIVHVRDGEEEEMTADELEVWNKFLPIQNRGNVKKEEKENDKKVDQTLHKEIALYSCSDFTGKLEIQLIKKGKLEHKDLNGDDAFIVDGNQLGIWVWLGRKSSATERSEAMGAGQKFIEKNGLPRHTRVTKVNMGGEPEEFKSLFINW